jgi:hypothetical protein
LSTTSLYGVPGSIKLKLRTSDASYFERPVISNMPKRNSGPLAISM